MHVLHECCSEWPSELVMGNQVLFRTAIIDFCVLSLVFYMTAAYSVICKSLPIVCELSRYTNPVMYPHK
jgi:hypothetical protein